jgi:hypothetical protein
MVCRNCGARDVLRRHHRRGFFQRRIFPIFGLFPWECMLCRKVKLYRQKLKRNQQVDKDAASVDRQ